MEENNNTPGTHHNNNNKRATTQKKKKTPRQRKYRPGTHVDALCKRTRIQRWWKNTCKLKEECRFLHFLTHSKNIAQSKKILRQLLSKHQYTVLRELVINDLASNLPTYGSTKKKAELRKSLKKETGTLGQRTVLQGLPAYPLSLLTIACHSHLMIPWHL